ERSVGLVFQDYALFPHLSVEDNVGFGARGPVDGLLRRLGIERLAGARPRELSGGERQRVALARALAREPKALLLDEPLAALDAATRASVRAYLRDLLRELRLPALVVTHDYADAIALADRIGVLVEGKLVQLGTASELLTSPATPFVGDLVGGNVLSGRASRRADGLTEIEPGEGSSWTRKHRVGESSPCRSGYACSGSSIRRCCGRTSGSRCSSWCCPPTSTSR